jgi:hypothetical protein
VLKEFDRFKIPTVLRKRSDLTRGKGGFVPEGDVEDEGFELEGDTDDGDVDDEVAEENDGLRCLSIVMFCLMLLLIGIVIDKGIGGMMMVGSIDGDEDVE